MGIGKFVAGISGYNALMPDVPNMHAVSVLILTAAALILFTRERIPLETSSFLVLVLLTVGFELFPFQNAAGQELHPARVRGVPRCALGLRVIGGCAAR